MLSAAASRLRPGSRWILLRGTSETIKREIFRYRARTGIYSHANTREKSRQVKLAQAVGSAMGSLMRTDVNLLGFDPDLVARKKPKGPSSKKTPDAPVEPPDNRMSRLTPAGYIRHRVDKQIAWYLDRAARLEREARWLRWLALIFGGAGTILAATGLQIWVAVTTTLIGVYTTVIEALQLETTVTLYNQAATDLGSIRAWWFALLPSEQDRQENIDRLVEGSERIMRAEHVGWVQEMQDAMTQLRLEQAADAEAAKGGSKPDDEDEDGDGDGEKT
jgi:hypothetical protein